MFCILSVVSFSVWLLREHTFVMQMLFVPLFVKQAPEKGIDNQPLAKLGLYAPLSVVKLKTGGTSKLSPECAWDKCDNILEITILGESDATKLHVASFSRKKRRHILHLRRKKKSKAKKKERAVEFTEGTGGGPTNWNWADWCVFYPLLKCLQTEWAVRTFTVVTLQSQDSTGRGFSSVMALSPYLFRHLIRRHRGDGGRCKSRTLCLITTYFLHP